MRRIDAHQHYWCIERGDYTWLTPSLGALYRDFSPRDLDAERHSAGVTATVLVQAAATEAETRYLLGLAREHASIAGVVGWVDFEAPDVGQRIARLMAEGAGMLRGLRPMVQDIPDPRWLERVSLDAAFEALITHDLAFDALVRPAHLPALTARLSRHPRVRAVLDHCGKPDIAGAAFEGWAEQIRRLAEQTRACCKLSGLLTEAGPDATCEDLLRYVQQVVRCFGPARILWGSDWPVLTLRAAYGRWMEMALELVRRLAPGHEQAIFRDNAARFYQLDPARI